MIKSMTGYGIGEYSDESYKVKVEIKSVNNRYNDITVRMPRHLSYLEENIKKIIKDKVKRGKVDVYINLDYINESEVEVHIDIPLAKAYKESLENLVTELNLDDKLRLNNILGLSEVVKTKRKTIDEDQIWTILKEALSIAVINIVDMRAKEGLELKKDLLSKVDIVESNLIKIKERAPLVVLEYKYKLKERLNTILDENIQLDEERLSNEVVFFADKSSVDEELVRLYSHIGQFKSILEEEDLVGRKLDFLIQEFNREVNTIGSKANDITITKYVVELKAELEKIREQIQNIE